MRKIRRFVRKHPRYSFGLYVICVLTIGAGLFLAVINLGLPGTVWLPDSTKYTSDDAVIFDLPVKSEIVATSYGKAVRYTSAIDRSLAEKDPQPSTIIDEFQANPRLKTSACPDISGIESLLPSGCDKIGELQGNAVYTIRRRLPSTASEYFTQVNGTFIYVKTGDAGADYNPLQEFIPFSRHRTYGYLAANNKRAEQIVKKRQAANAAKKRANNLSYTHLDFTPVLATAVPDGWTSEGNNPKQIIVSGPDADHPKLISTYYYVKEKNGQKGKSVEWHSGNLADFVVMGTCGPTPGYSMKYLPCTRVPGTDLYAAELYDSYNDYARYMYYPVGNSLVITGISVNANGNGRPARPTDLIQAQNMITTSAKTVSKNTLEGSSYDELYY